MFSINTMLLLYIIIDKSKIVTYGLCLRFFVNKEFIDCSYINDKIIQPYTVKRHCSKGEPRWL